VIIITQIAVIIVAVGIVFFGLSGRKTHLASAWKKIAIFLLAIAMVVAVIFPNTTDALAHAVGVGRGADLLLYVLTLAFITSVLNSYIRQKDEHDALFRLARRVALLDANERYNIKKD
jgi:hypothetical protein